MNRISAHFENENFNLIVSNKETGKDLQTIQINQNLDMYMTLEQMTMIHDKIGKALYGESYSDLQDKLFNKDVDLETANELIEGLEENLANAM